MSLNEHCSYDDLVPSDLFKVDSFQNFLDLHGVGSLGPDFSEDGGPEVVSETVSIESGASPQNHLSFQANPAKSENGKYASEDGQYDQQPSGECTPEGRRKPRRDPEKNRNAQVKAKALQYEQTIAALQAQVAALMQERVDLQIRCSVLEGISDTQDAHLDKVRTDKALNDEEEQRSILGDAAILSGDVQGHPVSLQEAKQWTLKDLMQMRQRGLQMEMDWLLSGASEDVNSPAGVELTEFILRRRKVNSRIAVGNPKTMQGIYAFEVMQARELPEEPTENLWKRVLESLMLSAQQQTLLLEARGSLLVSMAVIAQKRQQLMGFQQGVSGKTLKEALEDNLEEERKAVRNFLVCFFDEVLSPIQEARCDVYSFPFCPQVLALTNILHGGSSTSQPHVPLPDVRGLAQGCGFTHWPENTPFQVLSVPAMTRCYILTLQRALFMHRSGATPIKLPDAPRETLLDMSVLAFGR